MAFVKGHALRGNIQRAIDYIVNEAKTKNDTLVSWQSLSGASPSTIGISWSVRKELVEQKDHRKKTDIVGYHFVQSFAPNEVDEDKAHEIGCQFVEELTSGKYDYVIATHIDQGHIHNHIIVNPIHNETEKLWNVFWRRDLKYFREISDKICSEHGLSVIQQNQFSNDKSYYEWMVSQRGDSARDIVRKMLDDLVERVSDYSQLKSCLQKLGFEVEDGMDEGNENKFEFTANKKMLVEEKEDVLYFRIPYKKEILEIPKEQVEMIKEDTAKITLLDQSYSIYDINGIHIRDSELNDIKKDWDDKTKSKRTGLRIKPPGYEKFIRCDRLGSHNHSYSLDGLIERINNNDVVFPDNDIMQLLTDMKVDRSSFYSKANIKEKWKESTIYKSIQQERYFKWKTQTVMNKYNALAYERYMSEEKDNIELYKQQRKDAVHDLDQCSKDLKKAEEMYKMVEEKSILGFIEITDEELKKLVVDTIEPLQKTRTELKSKILYYDRMIENVEEYDKKQQSKEKVR